MKDSAPPLGRWLTVLALVAVLLIVAAWLPRRVHQDPLSVAVGLWPGCETFLLARERGLLPSDHVQLVEMTWASATMRAFGSGVVDAAVLSLDEVMRLRESGRDLRVVLIMDVSKGNDALLVHQSLRSIAELKGHKVGVDINASGMYLLTCALEQAGMKSSDLQLVPLNLPETEESYTAGEVDAVITAEPWLTKLRNAGGHTLFDSAQATTPLYRVLVVSEEALREQRADVVALLHAHFAMRKELSRKSEVPGLDVVLRRQGLPKAEYFQCLDHLQAFSVEENLALLGDGAQGLKADTASVEKRMRDHEMLYRPLSPKPWIDSSLLEEMR